MRRILIGMIALMLLWGGADGAGADSLDWGPGGAGAYSPEYPIPATIRVVDAIAYTIPAGGGGRQLWYEIRNAALALWEPSGVGFVVVREFYNEAQGSCVVPSLLGADRQLVDDAILLIQSCDTPGDSGFFGGWIDVPVYGVSDAGLAAIRAKGPVFRKGWNWRLARYFVAHEVGHALGLGHGGNGIMAGAFVPNSQEIAVVRQYYFGQ